jgi:hypothetical protein
VLHESDEKERQSTNKCLNLLYRCAQFSTYCKVRRSEMAAGNGEIRTSKCDKYVILCVQSIEEEAKAKQGNQPRPRLW